MFSSTQDYACNRYKTVLYQRHLSRTARGLYTESAWWGLRYVVNRFGIATCIFRVVWLASAWLRISGRYKLIKILLTSLLFCKGGRGVLIRLIHSPNK